MGGDDAAAAKWFSLNEIPSLAFDHDYMLRMATQRLREEIHFQPIGFELLPEKFTIKELQSLYEAILGISFDVAVLLHKGKLSIDTIMGSHIDVLKLQTCMNLFKRIAPNDIFQEVLEAYF